MRVDNGNNNNNKNTINNNNNNNNTSINTNTSTNTNNTKNTKSKAKSKAKKDLPKLRGRQLRRHEQRTRSLSPSRGGVPVVQNLKIIPDDEVSFALEMGKDSIGTIIIENTSNKSTYAFRVKTNAPVSLPILYIHIPIPNRLIFYTFHFSTILTYYCNIHYYYYYYYRIDI